MMILLPDVLPPDRAREICEALTAAPFRDGKVTAGAAAAPVKDNQQARGDDPTVLALAREARLALEAHPVMRRLARPARWSNLIFSRYGQGHQYGRHADNAGMSDDQGWPLRTDRSFTLFLSAPETYEGGALVIEDLGGERAFRLPAGSASLYPTGRLHRVAPVTAGERLACVGWVQSFIRNPDQREVLYDLEQVRDAFPPGDAALRLDKTLGALLRMWGEA